MRFENIKVGDKVVISKCVSYGFRRNKWFKVIETVTKTTKTQFTAGGNRYKKDRGYMIGNTWISAEVYTDDSQCERKQMMRFKKKLGYSSYIKNSIYDISNALQKKELHDLDLPFLDDLKTQVNKLKDLIKE